MARSGAAPPVRLVHLGLGNFFRAHQAWYTDRAGDGWGIAAFSGRSAELAGALSAQDGLYTLVTRARDGDRLDVISSLARAYPAARHDAWLATVASPDVRAMTITITEAGYLRGAHAELQADAQALRADPTAPVRTAPARILAGLAARRRADAGPFTIIPCDNLPENGAVVARVVADLADRVDPGLREWLEASVTTVTTMVDRITPRTTPEDTVAGDRCPVITEPFSEWVLSGRFAGGRPRWEDAGALFTDDIAPFEERKLWLLNGGHSLLAYAGSARGHETVADSVADETCRTWLETWWAEASAHLTLPADDLARYREALLERFANPRMRHLLAQIAADGSQKLPIRILPVLRAERSAGRMPAGAVRALAAWIGHLRGAGAPVVDPRAEELVALAAGPLPEAVRRILEALDPALAGDDELVASVRDSV
ncbi:mannitol dehydrogenase family protein [Solirubrobacter ginsenosidimutans]|uniref:Mannitol dehydrogenase family protein n=1 Tax=Solirubrobacter ginsenosidimutans TaxID=490573 RepID=A0A9X3S223_9ACTN|nr:mannitol dehydrogenase family protein [Solirubrobacter ginsenosidimutans]MDA0164085.1 mannitol dehydrogenase family protein [Solirubrobacter ginsenosidimutans]